MEKYTVSRELAEKLKKAGFPRTTQYTYYIFHSEVKFLDKISVNQHFSDRAVSDDDLFAAPISDELLEQLPHHIESQGQLELIKWQTSGSYRCGYYRAEPNSLYKTDNTQFSVCRDADTLAEALAHLYLWCAEHGYLEGKHA